MNIKNIFFNIYEVKQQVLKKPNEFIEMFKNVLLLEGVTKAIKLMKISGICYSIFGCRNDSLFEQTVGLLVTSCGKDNAEVVRLLDEVSIIHKLFDDFNLLKSKSGLDAIPKEEQVCCFLLAAESQMSALVEYSKGIKNWREIKTIYPLAKCPMSREGTFLTPISDILELGAMYDNYVCYIGKILTYFYYQEIPFSGSDKILSIENIVIAGRHLQLFDLFDRLSSIYESWMFFDCLLKLEENEIYFCPIDKEYLSVKISLCRFNHLNNQKAIEFPNVIKGIDFQQTTRDLFPIGFRSPNEVFSGMLCQHSLGSAELNERVLDVSISEWLRAFTILSEIGQQVIAIRETQPDLSLKQWGIFKGKDEWIDEFTKGGIVADKAAIIIDNLTFRRGGVDILDCPFIVFEDKLLCSPGSICNLSASQSILSNFNAKKLDVSFKGKKFEQDTNRLLNEAGIPAHSLYENKNNSEYQCDSVFVISDELYLLECKSFTQPRTPKDYYELLVKTEEASVQLGRTAEHLLCRSELLRKKLKLDSNWQPKHVYKIILTKSNFGSAVFINDCYAIDESVFVRFFNRECFAIVKDKVRIPIPDQNLLGLITNKKLINYIKDPPQIKFIENNYIKQEYKVRIYDYSCRFIEFEEVSPLIRFIEIGSDI